jgi:ketosteroid isomerase-like protein
MSFVKPLPVILPFVLFFIAACSHKQPDIQKQEAYVYEIDSQELYNTISKLDSTYWKAYNTCDMETQASMYADSLEFYHDKGGLMKSKQDVLDGIKKYVCNKVTRELLPGTIEIYPIKDFGAVEMGVHKFHNKEEPDAPSHPGRFIMIWQQTGNDWKIKRVISLH